MPVTISGKETTSVYFVLEIFLLHLLSTLYTRARTAHMHTLRRVHGVHIQNGKGDADMSWLALPSQPTTLLHYPYNAAAYQGICRYRLSRLWIDAAGFEPQPTDSMASEVTISYTTRNKARVPTLLTIDRVVHSTHGNDVTLTHNMKSVLTAYVIRVRPGIISCVP